LTVNIWISKELKFSGKIIDVSELFSDSINNSRDSGRNCNEGDSDNVLITCLVDERGFELSCKFVLSGVFKWEKMAMIMGCSDETGLGNDYGDFLFGIKYDTEIFEAEYETKAKGVDVYVDDLKKYL